MESTTNVAPISKSQLLTGRVLSTLGVLFLLIDAVMKFVKPAMVVETTEKLGYSASAITPLGILLLTCVALYCIPPTRVLGAILLTGYLGGAVATHVRVGDPLSLIYFSRRTSLRCSGSGFTSAIRRCGHSFLFVKAS